MHEGLTSAGAGQEGQGWARWLPGLFTLRHYQRAWLFYDIVAGLVLTAILVPVGMGYAEASGVPPIHQIAQHAQVTRLHAGPDLQAQCRHPWP